MDEVQQSNHSKWNRMKSSNFYSFVPLAAAFGAMAHGKKQTSIQIFRAHKSYTECMKEKERESILQQMYIIYYVNTVMQILVSTKLVCSTKFRCPSLCTKYIFFCLESKKIIFDYNVFQ